MRLVAMKVKFGRKKVLQQLCVCVCVCVCVCACACPAAHDTGQDSGVCVCVCVSARQHDI